jgi:hypothetical protein
MEEGTAVNPMARYQSDVLDPRRVRAADLRLRP